MLETIKQLPGTYGIYQYFDHKGKLLYVGKAKNLKNRVKSYWRFTPRLHPNPAQGARILKMLSEAVRLEYMVVESEADALILENSLIKQLRPKYNILLRDDKTYPYIYIDESQDFPRFELTRRVVKGENIHYYGPFPTGGRALLDALYEIYPLVQKRSGLEGGEACLFHQIGKCLAPCEAKVTRAQYHALIADARKTIHNRARITEKLHVRMLALAEQERYEEAGKIRDQITAITSLELHSGIDLAKRNNSDIFAIATAKEQGIVLRIFMREGKIISSSHTFFRQTAYFDTDEAYRQVLLDYYHAELPSFPEEILISEAFDSAQEISRTLSQRLGTKLSVKHPKRGEKHRLIALARKNALELLKQKKTAASSIESDMAALLALERNPYRVEAFDNSHMMGVASVGAMVVWDEGAWDKASYRRYALCAKDEVGQMTEMLQRRIKEFDNTPPPDLWVLDGGQVNLTLAQTLLKAVGVNLPVVAIAKEKLDSKAHRAKGAAKDILHTAQGVLTLKPSDKRLQWLQRLRDESHRFAIAYHQEKKRKEDIQLSLLQKKGIGKATVKKLINYFGTFEKIAAASSEEIAAATDQSIARILST